MKKTLLAILLIGISFSCLADKIYPQANAQEILTIMKAQGYSASLDKDSDILWMCDGVKQLILFKDGTKQNTDITFRCSYTIDASNLTTKLEKCNDYNKKYKIGRAFINRKNNTVIMDMILHLRGGVTEERIIDFLDDCKIARTTWEKEVVEAK